MGVFKTQSKVENYILENNMIGGATKVYVATSGGADSMALLATLVEFRNELGIEVGAVHVNHGIRGETARRDANFVKDYCSSYDIEFVLFDAEQDGVKVPENASEDWARQLRYNYFSKLINKTTKVATAHTLSDQAETVIFRMTRGGSGLNGLSGIPPVRVITSGHFFVSQDKKWKNSLNTTALVTLQMKPTLVMIIVVIKSGTMSSQFLRESILPLRDQLVKSVREWKKHRSLSMVRPKLN